MPSWNNATPVAGRVLDPERTAALASLRRDAVVSPELAPYVERFWSVRWDRETPYRAEVLTDPSVHLSVESGTHPRFGHQLPAALVHGVVTRRFAVDLYGAGRVSAAKFRPGGFTAMTGVRPGRDSVCLAGAPFEAVLPAVLAEPDDAGRASVLDALLRPLAPGPSEDYLLLQALLDRVRDDRGLHQVGELARDAGLSVRSVQRLFRHYVGVGAKAVLVRTRLQEAVAALDAGQDVDLAALAASLGWYDQAHFSREFRAVVGRTPSSYLRAAAAPQS